MCIRDRHKHKTGYLYEVEIRANFIELEGLEFSCSIVTDVRKKKLEQELLRTISEQTSCLTGLDYFRELVKYVTASLNVRYSFIVECSNEEKTRVRTLSYVDRMQVCLLYTSDAADER